MINYADIIVIAIFLIFCIIGFARGFMRSLTKLMGSFLSLILAMFLCSYVCAMICSSSLDEWMIRSFSDMYQGLGGSINMPVSAGDGDAVISSLVSIGIPSFIAKLFAPSLIALIPEGTIQPVSMLLAGFTAQIILVTVVTIILFIIIRLLIKLLNILIRLILKDKLMRIVDRVLGLAFGGVKALFCIFVILTVGNYFLDQPYAAAVKNQITGGSVANVFYENNVVKSLCDKYLDFDRLLRQLTDWIGGDKTTPDKETDVNPPDGSESETESGGESASALLQQRSEIKNNSPPWRFVYG